MHVRNRSLEDVGHMPTLNIDRRSREVSLDGDVVEMTRTEFDLLDLMSRYPRQVFTPRQLFDALWDASWFDGDHVIESHISRLRGKLRESGSAPRFIHTVRGVGYRFEPGPAGCTNIQDAECLSPRRADPADELVVILSPELTIVHMSESMRQLLGADGAEILGLQPQFLVGMFEAGDRLSIEARAVSDASGRLASIHLRLRPSTREMSG